MDIPLSDPLNLLDPIGNNFIQSALCLGVSKVGVGEKCCGGVIDWFIICEFNSLAMIEFSKFEVVCKMLFLIFCFLNI